LLGQESGISGKKTRVKGKLGADICLLPESVVKALLRELRQLTGNDTDTAVDTGHGSRMYLTMILERVI
jgi:hypothetical protein